MAVERNRPLERFLFRQKQETLLRRRGRHSTYMASDTVLDLQRHRWRGCEIRRAEIETIGDAYMVVAGLPLPDSDPDTTIAQLALDMIDVVSTFKDPVTREPVQVRIGINSGGVVAGVIGNRKFADDL